LVNELPFGAAYEALVSRARDRDRSLRPRGRPYGTCWRGPDPGNFYWLLGRAYFTLATASGTPPEAVAKRYHDAIYWLQKSVQESPDRWYVRAHLISAYALTGRLGEREAKATL